MLRQLNEVVTHALPGEHPANADWTIDQGWDGYTPSEHAVWKTLFERQTRLLPAERATSSSPACAPFPSLPMAFPISAD
jgi:phenylalanine-4-hydroxylase